MQREGEEQDARARGPGTRPGPGPAEGLAGWAQVRDTLPYAPKASAPRGDEAQERCLESWSPWCPGKDTASAICCPGAPFAEQACDLVRYDHHFTLLSLSPGLDMTGMQGQNRPPPTATGGR